MSLFRGIQEYIALDANNITLVFDSGNIVNISGNIFLYPPQGHPILYNYWQACSVSVFGIQNPYFDTTNCCDWIRHIIKQKLEIFKWSADLIFFMKIDPHSFS